MVFTINNADVLPEATVTDLETVAEVSELLRLTTIPPAPAGPLNVTVPVDNVLPTTVGGLRLID